MTDLLAIWALDPGLTCGWARCVINLKLIKSQGISKFAGSALHFECGQQQFSDAVRAACWSYDEMTMWLLDMGEKYEVVLTFVSESFGNRPGHFTGDVTTAAEVSASVRTLLHYTEMELLISTRMQTPAEAKSYATDERLKSWGVWTPGKDHARDATRHLLAAVSRMA